MKNTWEGIRSIISLQQTTNDSPKIISLEGHNVTDTQAIANNFNSFFCSVAAEGRRCHFHIKGLLNIYHHLTKTHFSSHLVQNKK